MSDIRRMLLAKHREATEAFFSTPHGQRSDADGPCAFDPDGDPEEDCFLCYGGEDPRHCPGCSDIPELLLPCTNCGRQS